MYTLEGAVTHLLPPHTQLPLGCKNNLSHVERSAGEMLVRYQHIHFDVQLNDIHNQIAKKETHRESR